MSDRRSFIWLGGRDGAGAVVSEYVELQLDAGKPLLLLTPDRSKPAPRATWYRKVASTIGRGLSGHARRQAR